MTITELRLRCVAWLSDPTHKPDLGSKEKWANQDQHDLREARARICEIEQACATILRNGSALRHLEASEMAAKILS